MPSRSKSISEFDFGLLRVDIDVDARRVDRQVEEIGRRTALGDQFFIGLHDGAREVRTLEITSVDEEVLLAVAPLGGSRTADIAPDAGDRGVGIDLQQVLLDMASHHVDDTSRQRRGTERIDRGVVGVKFEGDMGVAQRNTLEFGLDLCGRSRTLVKETTAGGHVVKKVAHEELRPHGTHHGSLPGELAAVDFGLGTHLVALLPRAQFDLRHGRDRSERLAAEPERIEGVDVFDGSYLAGGMAVEGHTRVDGRHAAAVVHNLDQILAAVAEIDFHGGRTCVDGVFHHLLHHRCGTVDDLARSNLVGDDFG